MDISVLALDIDGTLRNPIVAVVVALYSVALAGVAAVVVRRLRRGASHRGQASLFMVSLAVAIMAALNGPIIRALVAYVVSASSTFQGTVGVGYFGHHPVWLVPAFVVVGALLGNIRRATREPAVA